MVSHEDFCRLWVLILSQNSPVDDRRFSDRRKHRRSITQRFLGSVLSRFFSLARSKTADWSVYTASTYATIELHFRKSNRENRRAGASSQLHCLYERANNGTTHFLCEYILTIASRSRTCRQANTYDDARRSLLGKIDTSLLDLPRLCPHRFTRSSFDISVGLPPICSIHRPSLWTFPNEREFPRFAEV